MIRVLLSTTSYQDTPGDHHALLEGSGVEIVRQRGPLNEAQMLEIAGEFDAFLCGDDAITRAVIDKSLPRLRVMSKYGIGVDKIDAAYATEKGIPLSFCPGVNHTTVAEHVFMLLLALHKNLIEQANATCQGGWKRMTGHEIMGKTIGIIGLGRIGKEVAIRAKAFGMETIGFDIHWPEEFANAHGVKRAASVDEVLEASDIVSLHTNLTEETRGMIDAAAIARMKKGATVINCGRGELVVSEDIAAALEDGTLGGYGADVLDEEPPDPAHPLLGATNALITPHVGSRTYESVQRQAVMATRNLINMLRGEKPLAQVNDAPIPAAVI